MANMSRDGATTHRDDVEGHAVGANVNETVERDDDTDVEGHIKPGGGGSVIRDDDDVEGHKQPPPGVIRDDDDDVEGHAKPKG